MKKYSIILTTCNNNKVKKEIINHLLNKNLTACIQVKKIESYYIWNNKIQQDDEYQLIIKTVAINYFKIEKIIKDFHDYKTPQIIQIPITEGSKDYLKWIDDVVR